jgi:hypothetical protein
LTPDQVKITESVKHNKFTLVKASHSIGKTSSAALLSSWWYDCWDRHIVYITAPNWEQALGLTFKEIRARRQEAGLIPARGKVWERGYIRDPDPLLRHYHYIRAINADKPEGITGEHSAPILIIIEEGVGVRPEIWSALMGLMTTPQNRILAIGNPTDESTEFGSKASSSNWNVFTISALDHPNIEWQLRTGYELGAPQKNPEGDPGPVPQAVSLDWVRDMMMAPHVTAIRDRDQRLEDEFWWVDIDEINRCVDLRVPADTSKQILYKPDAEFQGRVLGQFPTAQDRQVIPRSWVENLKPQPVPQDREIPPEIGVDIARYGADRSCLIARRGPCALKGKVLRQQDDLVVADAIRDMAEWVGLKQGYDPKAIAIKIDVTGNLGTGPHDILKSWGYSVYGVNASSKAMKPEMFPNRRSELWFATRERIRLGGLDLSRLDLDFRTELEKELTLPNFRVDLSGRKVVEDKDQMRRRTEGGKSPDLADACNLAYAGYDRRARDARRMIRDAFFEM